MSYSHQVCIYLTKMQQKRSFKYYYASKKLFYSDGKSDF